ncbi:metal-dependent hydrolase [Deferribacter thermophilus]|uniref:metal-dependent hydrolase n=1 Tax=Deferribacter thermophilus TaxID=53573 RepID=UPI003C2938B4
MDPVTHIGSGLLGGSYLKDKKSDKSIYIISVIGALLPDIDNIIGLANNPQLYLIHHRGITHSFLGAILLSFILALLLKYIFFRKTDLKKIFLIFTFFSFVHIFLDLITSYGTQIALPFTNERYTLECTFIIDPIFTVTILIFFFISKKLTSKKMRLILFSFIFVYPLSNLALKEIYTSMLEAKYPDKKVYLTPSPFTPIYWKIILEDSSFYYVTTKKLFAETHNADFAVYKSLKNSSLSKLFTVDGFLKTYYWFLKYPIVKQISNNEYKISDLRFIINFKNLKREAPFSLFLITDKNSNIRYYYNFKK